MSFLLNVIPIWWGLPSRDATTWAFDEIPTHHTGETLKTRHRGRYPPFHYMVLRTVYKPIKAVAHPCVLLLDAVTLRTILQLVGRAVSVLMATATVFLVFRIGRLLFAAEATSLLAAASAALVVPFVFFAKTVNLEAPYVFWFTVSLYFFVRVTRDHNLIDYLAFAVAMTLAVTTKDQAFGLYVLVPPMLWIDLYRLQKAEHGGAAGFFRTLLDPRLLVSALASGLLFALIHGLFTDWYSFVRHVQIITGRASQPSQMFEPSLSGHLDMLLLAVRHVAFSMGWPLLLMALLGIALALRDRAWPLLALLVFPVSYYLFFIVPILYHRVRYFLPLCIVLSLFAGRALAWLLGRPGAARWPGRLAVATLLFYSLLRPVSFLQEMIFDSRYAVEAWIERLPGDTRVIFIGANRPLLPRSRSVRSFDQAVRQGAEFLRNSQADFIVFNEDEFPSENRKWKYKKRMLSGELNYRLAFREQFQPWPFRLDRTGLATNLNTVNPPLVVFERQVTWEEWAR